MMELSSGLGDEETVEATEAAAAHTEDKVGEVGKEKEKDRKLSLRREPSFSRWCNEDGILRQSAVDDDGSPRTNSAAEESEEFELPLLHQRMPDEVGSQAEDQRRIHEFRQRSMFLGIVNGDTEKYVPLDIENDVHVSDSMTKIVSLEQSRNSAISFAILLKTLFYILVWYTLSTCLTVYNKTLLGDNLGKFPAPLLMNTIHFSLQAIFSNVIVYIQSRNSESSNNIMTWKDYFARVIPTAIGTALDVNLSNESLVYITVTFATMCKSASPIFLLMFAFAFRLEKPSLKLVGIMLIISVGVLLTETWPPEFDVALVHLSITKETKFEFWGFIFVMLSAVMAGFRWCMTQILLQVLMEYILVSATSAVTVTVAGIVKEAVTILVAVFYFHDQFTWLKGVGLLTIMVGVSLFNCFKYYNLKKEGTNRLTERDAKYVILDDTELQDDELEFPSV
ncbi:hypothetical protein ZIOFF_072356 [Zingiber officinale]|uniref:Sugar phosphate transporter domain-containing protein n=1 Tax=Zingiber officinale TaxID=94328 RepID=A0A8J5CAV2_ZINOF|nr:hypothetical protein ZIOFF_072356 [Zingiber officinale]